MTNHSEPAPATPLADATALLPTLRSWFDEYGRDLPWRTPETTAWGVLVSEVMSQQTPVARVAPQWLEWMDRWPDPTAFAAASQADVLRAWGRLGYPRRALRLWECAQAIVAQYDGVVPRDVDELLALPGIGDYTARAVACFAFGVNVPVVDTNVRRVYARAWSGQFLAPQPAKRQLTQVGALLADGSGPQTSVALMELGALVCTARSPRCSVCPLRAGCAWVRAGSPAPSDSEMAAQKKRVQKFAGTDRQVRGKIMAVLREASAPVPKPEIDLVWPKDEQRERALRSLLADGLVREVTGGGEFALPD
ncbi:A/G-specific adenine glycosylase [Corynebacterium propinquum]|uniref:A/G-specific adenine glycosylase n=1 Tax=Corynebacterium propinquum TaxID=43769 RepID=UPI0009E4A651|nr:A/G-specific adenine glycosylase [Corynebacterium propinquum]WKS31310.1 A/G-specific adenine glycosylase [Corynebacterium propinquum]WKS35687.1 A/G-specific adenine glycosylase [Corynebacterium propinquum]WKS37715.1 A/G-specific adenine glycosylase [Corynebacterium propinquum]WKS41950.1 A/G-specific adenine glycosylase [Corynebacterium propinquum]WKS48115.1 A/G-specific adenine glycosylase [Corynebacterium propinquum]